MRWHIKKVERGFKITYRTTPKGAASVAEIISHPYIPKKRYRVFYPYALACSVRAIREHRRVFGAPVR